MTDRARSNRHARRGSALAFTLFSCLIVATVGTGLLLASRVQLLRTRSTADMYEATLAAQAGLDLALHHLERTEDWRIGTVIADWAEPTGLGRASFAITVEDPVDGDLANSTYDPVVVTSTGIAGLARQKVRVRLDVQRVGLDCLRSSMHANGNLVLEGVNATSDHWFTANGGLLADSGDDPSHVYADVAAADGVEAKGGSVFHGATDLNITWPLDAPDPDAVFEYYLTHGTVIDIEDLPLWGRNLLVNPGMEGPPPDAPTTGWFGAGGCAVLADADEQDDGAYSLRATDRTTPEAGPAQDISDELVSGLTYHVLVRAGTVSDGDAQGRITIEWQSTEGPAQQWSSEWVGLSEGGFQTIESADKLFQPDSFTPTWTGSLVSATLRIETQSSLDDLRIDSASMVEITAYPFIRTIHREVLGPDHNPFGFGDTNPEGIYVIDCAGGLLSIQRSRISGTLVILNPHGAGTFIWSVVHWSPEVSNYPAILSNGVVNFWLGNDGGEKLVEGTANTNYNPPGAPFNALSDDDRTDTYGSLMRGIVYSSDTIVLRYRPLMEGVLICDGDIIGDQVSPFGPTELDVTYLSQFHNNAPPGFRKPPILTVAPGSFQRDVD